MISDNETPDGRKPAQPQKVLDNLRRQCSRREYCRSDVFRKAVKALDGDRVKAQEIVDSLVRDRFVDDMRYATAFVRDKSSLAGWGGVKIRYMLGAKGIERDVIEQAIGEIDDDKASARLEGLLENKYRSLRGDPQCRMKLLRFATGRGYSYSEAEETVSRLMNELL
ncbi:MAG: regulatory protein RecX [Candidatus Cryptobacteroides sp.]